MDTLSPVNPRWSTTVGRGGAALALLSLVHCGAGAGLRAEYDRLSTFPRAAARGEHVAFVVPLAVLGPLIDKKISERPFEKSVGFPALGLGVKVALVRVALEAARACASCLGVRVAFDVTAGKHAPAVVEVAGEIPVVATLEGARIDVALRVSQARKLTLKLSSGWKEKVATWLSALAPRGLLRATVLAAAPKVIDKLTNGLLGFAKTLLTTVGVDLDRRAHFSFALPAQKPGAEIPLRSVSLRSTATALVAVATTTLSVADDALSLPAGDEATGEAVGATIVVRGQTLFDAILYAMSRGKAPARFNAKGKPDAKGDFRISFEWVPASGGRIRVNFWKLSSPAGVVTLEGKLSLALTADRTLEVKTDGLRVVAKRGDFLFELGVWLKSELWGTTHDMVKSVAIPASIKVGGRPVPIHVRRVKVFDAGVLVETALPGLVRTEGN